MADENASITLNIVAACTVAPRPLRFLLLRATFPKVSAAHGMHFDGKFLQFLVLVDFLPKNRLVWTKLLLGTS
jgi:hypothetical protein